MEGTLDGLVQSPHDDGTQNLLRPGILVPLLNVNGFTSRIFLEKIDCITDFEARFGPCWQSCIDSPVWSDPAAARFLWEHSLPLDLLARRISDQGRKYSPCPQRFSIGCFAISREFWQAQGGFSVAPPGDLGVEEIDLAAYCATTSRPILVAEHLLVGHAGFGHQMPTMEPWLMENF